MHGATLPGVRPTGEGNRCEHGASGYDQATPDATHRLGPFHRPPPASQPVMLPARASYHPSNENTVSAGGALVNAGRRDSHA